MKLSEVLAYIELLNEKQLHTDFADASRHLSSIVHTIKNHPNQIGTFSDDIDAASQEVHRSFTQVDNVLIELRSVLEKVKNNLEPELMANSYRFWEEEMRFETTDYILNRKLAIDSEDFDVMYGHVLGYTDWRLPGLIIRPGKEKWIEHLVPLDPLYVVDTNKELIEPAVNKFTQEYQRRLRKYVINDVVRTSLTGQLPSNQFGFIFAYNYFNYRPIEIIERWLKELFVKLRSGGVLMFTYNDCDLSHCTALAEKNFMCYTPGSMIENQARLIGFEVVYRHQSKADVHWLELKKPGEIISYRGGQSLAKVIVKS